MQETSVHHYRGYAVRPSAHQLPDGYYSANLMLERPHAIRPDMHYRFYSLDYFRKEVDAIDFSRQWAQHWIDNNG